MFLKKLEITGFKSFAQKTTLEFDRGIVSIVGPNGSGKSNTADAIRWVLGEQSLKLLRGKKSDDVIFSGSSRKARLGMAEVSLWLDNEDRQMPIDYREVVITRRIYRDGEGEYLLNKSPVRLQDIHLLLAKSNFGQRSYSVIGQGMIDHVLVATPQERKVFFDEAAGVRQFQIKREQAISKLEQTKENLSQAQLLVAEIEPRLRTLTRQVRRLERRGVVEEELRTMQRHYYSQRLITLLQQLAEANKQARGESDEESQQQQELAKLQTQLEQLERERSRQEVFHDLQKDYSRVLEQKNTLLKEQVVLEGAHELAAAKSGELNLVWMENRHRELERSLADMTEELSVVRTDCEQRRKFLKERDGQHRIVADDLAGLEETLRTVREKLDREGVDVTVLTSELRTLHEEFASLATTLEKTESERQLKEFRKETKQFHDRFTTLVQRFQSAAGSVQPKELLAHLDKFSKLFLSKDELLKETHGFRAQLERKEERLVLLTQSLERLTDERARVERDLERLAPAKRGERRATEEQREDVEKQIRALDQKLQDLRTSIMNFNTQEQQKKEKLFELQKSFRVQQQALNESTNQLNTTRVTLAKLETRHDDLKREIRNELPPERTEELLTLTAESTPSSTEQEEKLLADIHRLQTQLDLIGGIDEGVTEEFQKTDERYNFLSTQITDLEQAIGSLEKIIKELDETIKKQFHTAFQAISRDFGKYFKVLFDGGNAKLVLQEAEVVVGEDEDEEEALEDAEEESAETPTPKKQKPKFEKIIAGVDIIATPPGKRISGITMLSGGERAMTSIALICAILSTRPSPFVVLDEVDAALDEANSQRFAAIVKELAHRTQFITITHNRATMQISSILYGVTMGDDGISKLLSVKMEEAEHVIRQHGNR